MKRRRAAAPNRAAAVVVAALLGLAGCAASGHGPYGDTDSDVVAAIDRGVTPMSFTVCHGYGCWKRSAVGLSPAQWHAVLALFDPAAPDPAAERARVAEAIALMERAVGRRTGTEKDAPRAPLNLGDLEQLDCVDETINTSVYLDMLHHAGLLRWHEPGEPARRGAFYTLNVHFTATIRDVRSGMYYAVDSWFFANGQPAAVVPLPVWRSGWHPGEPLTAARSVSFPEARR